MQFKPNKLMLTVALLSGLVLGTAATTEPASFTSNNDVVAAARVHHKLARHVKKHAKKRAKKHAKRTNKKKKAAKRAKKAKHVKRVKRAKKGQKKNGLSQLNALNPFVKETGTQPLGKTTLY